MTMVESARKERARTAPAREPRVGKRYGFSVRLTERQRRDLQTLADARGLTLNGLAEICIRNVVGND